jgi:hypothetical protein
LSRICGQEDKLKKPAGPGYHFEDTDRTTATASKPRYSLSIRCLSRNVCIKKLHSSKLYAHLQPFGVVDQGSKNDYAQDEEEHQQGQLLRARFERVHEYLQTWAMPCQLEQPVLINKAGIHQFIEK